MEINKNTIREKKKDNSKVEHLGDKNWAKRSIGAKNWKPSPIVLLISSLKTLVYWCDVESKYIQNLTIGSLGLF